VGCTNCSGTGYRGRLAIHEVLEMSEEIDHLVVSNAIPRDIQALAISQGMITMREDGLRKAASGETSLEEILRAVG
jgi:type IV pilus assembly protein PilB